MWRDALGTATDLHGKAHPWLSTAMAPQSVSTLQKTCDSTSGASIMSLCSLAADSFTNELKFLQAPAIQGLGL